MFVKLQKISNWTEGKAVLKIIYSLDCYLFCFGNYNYPFMEWTLSPLVFFRYCLDYWTRENCKNPKWFYYCILLFFVSLHTVFIFVWFCQCEYIYIFSSLNLVCFLFMFFCSNSNFSRDWRLLVSNSVGHTSSNLKFVVQIYSEGFTFCNTDRRNGKLHAHSQPHNAREPHETCSTHLLLYPLVNLIFLSMTVFFSCWWNSDLSRDVC